MLSFRNADNQFQNSESSLNELQPFLGKIVWSLHNMTDMNTLFVSHPFKVLGPSFEC